MTWPQECQASLKNPPNATQQKKDLKSAHATIFV
jgi:hypothetical protein